MDIEKESKKDETKDAHSKVRKEIRHNTDEKLLKEFSTRFQQVHEGFYETLLKKYPDLTRNELKLCAFLKLNILTSTPGHTKIFSKNFHRTAWQSTYAWWLVALSLLEYSC